jgi:hypothetical protein
MKMNGGNISRGRLRQTSALEHGRCEKLFVLFTKH